MLKSQKRNFISLIASIAVVLLLFLSLSGCNSGTQESNESTQAQTEKMEILTLLGPTAPVTLPMLQMVDQNLMSDVANQSQFQLWQSPDQLRAQVASGKSHFAAFPTYVAANLYNKGVKLKMLNVSVWSLLYVVSADTEVDALEDLKGQKVVVPWQGDMPDLVFRFLAQEKGIDPVKDIEVQYVSSPMEAAQLLVAGKVKHAILSEPAASTAILQAKQKGVSLNRVVDLQKVWEDVTGRPSKIPFAGIAVLPPILENNPNAVNDFVQAYKEATDWVIAHPQESGALAEKYIEGVKAPAVISSLQHSQLEVVPIAEVREDLEFFFTQLSKLSPEIIGGKLPDDDFYWQAE